MQELYLQKFFFQNFPQIKVFVGGPCTGEFIHFAVNYLGDSFLKILFSWFGKQENFTWRKFLLQIVSQTLRLFTESHSSNF